MMIRAKKCKTCNHITGILNDACEECDSTDLFVIEYEPEPSEEPSWAVTVRRVVDSSEVGFQWETTLRANLNDFESFLDGHDLEIIEVTEDGARKKSIGAMTVFWVFSPIDALRVTELVKKLATMRPGILDDAQIEVEYHDTVEV